MKMNPNPRTSPEPLGILGILGTRWARPWTRPERSWDRPLTPRGPKDYKNGHSSINVQRQKLSIPASTSVCCNASF